MGLFRRISTQKAPDLRAVGREAAFGIVPDADVDLGRSAEPLGINCGTCGTVGRIDMIDTTVRRAYLTCRRCGRIWDTDRASLPAQPFSSRSQ